MEKFSSGKNSIFADEIIGRDQDAQDVYQSSPPVAQISFIVRGDYYQAVLSPWDYLCSTHSEDKPLPLTPELKAEFDAWDAASDEISDFPQEFDA